MDLFVVAQSCARQSSGRHYKATILLWPDKASCTFDELSLQRFRGLHQNRAIGKIDKLEAWSSGIFDISGPLRRTTALAAAHACCTYRSRLSASRSPTSNGKWESRC